MVVRCVLELITLEERSPTHHTFLGIRCAHRRYINHDMMYLFFLEGVSALNHSEVNCTHRRIVGIGADSRVRSIIIAHKMAQQFLSYIWGSRCYLLCTLDEKEELQQSTGDMID